MGNPCGKLTDRGHLLLLHKLAMSGLELIICLAKLFINLLYIGHVMQSYDSAVLIRVIVPFDSKPSAGTLMIKLLRIVVQPSKVKPAGSKQLQPVKTEQIIISVHSGKLKKRLIAAKQASILSDEHDNVVNTVHCLLPLYLRMPHLLKKI